MASLNKVMLIGNLTRDPEFKSTPRGMSVAELGLAVSRKYKTESGEQREETCFVDVTLWGRLAEIARDYMTKGKPVYIEGRLQLDTWDDKTSGQKRSKMRVIGENVQLLGARGGEGGGDDGGGSYSGGGGGGESRSSRGGGGGGGGSSMADEYDQRPAPRQAQQSSGGGKPQQGGKPRPAPVQPDPDEEDDIPF